MADIKELKITEDKTRGKHVADLPVNPTEKGMSAQELQGQFDALPEVVIEAFNTLLDYLVGIGINNDAKDVRKSVNFIGTNPIDTPEKDTPANWIALGSGWAYINNSGKLKNQPAQWGFVENIAANGLVYQVWHSMTTAGTVFHRGGASNWYTDSWVKVADGDYALWGLSDIGLTNDDLSGDILSDIKLINSKMTNALPFYMQINATDLNGTAFGLAIRNKLKTDVGLDIGSYYDMVFTRTSADMLQIRVYPLLRNDNMYYAREYSCAFRRASDTALYLTPFVMTQNDKGFYGPHNKPSGSYTGNGSAAKRSIEFNTAGRTVAIFSNNGCALVLGYGAIVANANGVSYISGSEAYIGTNGVLSLSTDNISLNANGVAYYYHSL